MRLCHDENQKRRIIHEEEQKRKGTAQRLKTGLLRWHVHRIHGKNVPGAEDGGQTVQPGICQTNREKIKKCQKCQNPCSPGLNPPKRAIADFDVQP